MRYLMFFLCFCFVGSTYAQQNEEEMITESSDPFDENYYIDDIIQRDDERENRVLPYEHVREADIAWQKRIWRTLDTREKMNLAFQNVDAPLVKLVQEHLENGDIRGFKDESFKEPIAIEDIGGIFSYTDTITYFDEDTYEEKIRIVQNDIDVRDVKRYRLKEIWFFDEEASIMKVRIMGIAPLKDVIADDGTYLGEEALFWVYFPEARDYLSKHRVPNDFNDFAPMSWADLFDSRFFASYITKQSNTLGLRVKDMFSEDQGIDRLLEGEKIKMELFNFEHDLWEY